MMVFGKYRGEKNIRMEREVLRMVKNFKYLRSEISKAETLTERLKKMREYIPSNQTLIMG